MIPALGFTVLTVYMVIWCFYIVIWIKSRKREEENEKTVISDPKFQKGILRQFYNMGLYLLSWKCMKKLYASGVKQDLEILYPAGKQNEICRQYYAQKLGLVLLVSFVAVHMTGIVLYSEYAEKKATEKTGIKRGVYGSDAEEVLFTADGDMGKSTISFEVSVQSYTEQEIQKYIAQFEQECEKWIQGENESLSEVKSNLLLKSSYEDFPFTVVWESEDYALIDSDGSVYNEMLDKPREVVLTANITYEEYKYEHRFPVRICPRELSEKEKWESALEDALYAADKEQKYADTFQPPSEVDGKAVTFSIQQASELGKWVFLSVLTIAFLFFAKDRDLKKEIERRRQEMSMDYPEFISKFVLLSGAGETTRNIFAKLSQDQSLGKYLRREIQILVRNLKNGILESEAYDSFGKRTGNPLYIKFSAFLIQNQKKGNKDFTKLLEDEVKEACQLRKNHAKQLGEEAGTKLLIPMTLMLAIVMVIIVVPAFLSFKL